MCIRDSLKKMMASEDAQNITAVVEEHAVEELREGDEAVDEEDHDAEHDNGAKPPSPPTVEESAEEKALTQLFKRLDVDDGGSLSVDELKIALKEFNIDEDRESVVQLLQEVALHGDEGMGLDSFKESMMRLLAEPEEEEDIFEGMDEEQLSLIHI